jgi:hypothetical protein
MIYEILDGETVINTIVASPEFMQQNYPEGNYNLLPEPDPVPEPAKPYEWFIDIGPFFDRFGSVKMQVLTSSDAGVRALITDIQVRKWIDLKLPEVAQSLAYLGSVIPAVTPALQSSILNTPVGDHENLALRKLYFSA